MMKLNIDFLALPFFSFKVLYVGSYLLLVSQSDRYIPSIFKRKCVGVCFLTTLLKERFQQRCLPVNFTKFLRTPFFVEHLQWLLSVVIHTAAGFIGSFNFCFIVTTAFQILCVCLLVSNKDIIQGQIFDRLFQKKLLHTI